ncbi:hypothetical protein NE237_020837 [Protea cynaroides]|uniref:Uncharacterized protein n=1 Tax=Protea cynaroides TaxID=273540 RepID=A0A9Q0HBB6_9MAGN|nr:hypothetical protein NE237_020837 [Protea cynaroides]
MVEQILLRRPSRYEAHAISECLELSQGFWPKPCCDLGWGRLEKFNMMHLGMPLDYDELTQKVLNFPGDFGTGDDEEDAVPPPPLVKSGLYEEAPGALISGSGFKLSFL